MTDKKHDGNMSNRDEGGKRLKFAHSLNPNPGHLKFTKEKVAEALRASGGIIRPAAELLGCTRKTIYAYLERYPELEEVRREAKEDIVDLAETRLVKLVDEAHPSAVIFTLKTLGKNRGYVERQEHTGPDNKPIPVEVLMDARATLAERLEALASALNKQKCDNE